MMPLVSFSRGNAVGAAAVEYEPLEADDFVGLEHDGLDGSSATASVPTSPQSREFAAERSSFAGSHQSRISNSSHELGHYSSIPSTASRLGIGSDSRGNITDAAPPAYTVAAAVSTPVRCISRDATPLSVPRPRGGSSSLPQNGAYLDHIERIESSAEKMSWSMDIDTELRKMREEQKRADSRRSSTSIQRSRPQSRASTRQLKLNDLPSPGLHTSAVSGSPRLTSPMLSGDGSPQWSYFSGNRLAQTVDNGAQDTLSQPPVESRHPSSKLGDGCALQSPKLSLQTVFEDADGYGGGQQMVRQPSQAYTESVYSAEQGELSMQHNSSHGYPESLYIPNRQVQEQQDVHEDTTQQDQLRPDNSYANAFPTRRGSAGSGDTYQQATTLFKDFDGTHAEYHEDIGDKNQLAMDEPAELDALSDARRQSSLATKQEHEGSRSALEPSPENNDNAKRQSMLSLGGPLDPRRRSTMTLGPVRPQTPPDGHVYYPAPIPAILNLPQKLSKGPSAAERQRKKNEIIMSVGQRKSVLVPGMFEPANNPNAPPIDLDPHLKASLYFDHKPVKHELQLIEGSATRTLDNILDAAAFAPIGAFTDHPFAGELGTEVYGSAANATQASLNALQNRQSRMTHSAGLRQSSNPLATAQPGSSSPMSSGNKQRSSSAHALSLPRPLLEDNEEQAAHAGTESTPLTHPVHHDNEDEGNDYFADPDFPMPSDPNHFQDTVPSWVPLDAAKPTTLLAELQIRKAEQKQRNRTAANAFPNGMHSTLLQLDAVAQHQASARRGKQIRLAWEDPGNLVRDDEDDDVPLGMLVAGAKRPERGLLPPVPHGRTPSPGSGSGGEEEEQEETLGQRKARLAREAEERKRYTLEIDGLEGTSDAAGVADDSILDSDAENVPLNVRKQLLGHRKSRTLSTDFASEIMSELGGLDEEQQQGSATVGESPAKGHMRRRSKSKVLNAGKKSPEIEETLGQRRRRLQAQQAAKEDAKILQAEVKMRASSAELLQNANAHQANSSLGSLPPGLVQPNMTPQQMQPGFGMNQPWNGMLKAPVLQQQQQQHAFAQPHLQAQMWQRAPMQLQAQAAPGYGGQMPPQFQPLPMVNAVNIGMGQHGLVDMNAMHQQQQINHVNQMQQNQLQGMKPGRRDMVDRWRQGVMG